MKKIFSKDSDNLNPEFFLSIIKNLKKELSLYDKSIFLDSITINFMKNDINFSLNLWYLSEKPEFIRFFDVEKKKNESFKEFKKRTYKNLSIQDVINFYNDNINYIQSVVIIKKDFFKIPDYNNKNLCLFFNGYLRINKETNIKLIYSYKKHDIINQDHGYIDSILKQFFNVGYLYYNNQLLHLTDYYILY